MSTKFCCWILILLPNLIGDICIKVPGLSFCYCYLLTVLSIKVRKSAGTGPFKEVWGSSGAEASKRDFLSLWIGPPYELRPALLMVVLFASHEFFSIFNSFSLAFIMLGWSLFESSFFISCSLVTSEILPRLFLPLWAVASFLEDAKLWWAWDFLRLVANVELSTKLFLVCSNERT